ncbi:hypothetical protein GGX14DRAFT_658975 [Mycena pura]|uniref:Uncharacterized protein n=1 Tax=Mycena pura TaxID=153505 RepID=A0AAD6V535_9AGAR|nr:hypothetical protein GGX14DRAFT_658975 [Mycena pura]
MSGESGGEVTPLQQYASYPFSADDEYQSGLATLLADGVLENNSADEIRDEILRRTRVFYFNRVTDHALSIDAVRDFELAQEAQGEVLVNTATQSDPSPSLANTPVPAPATAESEPAFLTFAQLQALIETGREDQIPNNKIIPEGLNDEAPSVPSVPVRKKPWEMDSSNAEMAPVS